MVASGNHHTKREHPIMRYDVPLIPQSTTMSCWAASIAMILAWRDRASYSPERIASNPGGLSYTPSLQSGLDPNDTSILCVNGFDIVPPQCFSRGSIHSLLTAHGPLWVTSFVPAGPHIRVVCGLVGQTLYFNDPAPVGRGGRYTQSFATFFGAMEGLGTQELSQPTPCYVAHLAMCT
jgi:Papain-like cysteine protease AvrRpt2